MKRTEYDNDIFPERVQCQMSKTPSETGFGVLILLILSRDHIKRFEAKTIKAAKKRRAAKAFLAFLANDLRQH